VFVGLHSLLGVEVESATATGRRFEDERARVALAVDRGRIVSVRTPVPCSGKKEGNAMTQHRTGTREEWLAARLELLEAEKELTRRSDELTRQRQQVPWVRIDKDYRFETDDGNASLADLFGGRSQLPSARPLATQPKPSSRRGASDPRLR
jgi:hypothetical protein